MKFFMKLFFFSFLIFATFTNETKLENSSNTREKVKTTLLNSIQSSNEVKNLAKTEAKNESKLKLLSKSKVESKSKIQSKIKDKRSMMEYLNGLYSSKSNQLDSNLEQLSPKEKSKKLNKGSVLNNINMSWNPLKVSNIPSIPITPNIKLPSKIVLPKKDILRLILEDWLKISSPMFKNKARFPPISMPNGTYIEINVDHNFFRYNNAFNDNNPDPDMPPDNFYFWFRLSGKNIYYSSTKTDVNILGAVKIANVIDGIPFDDYSNEATCFTVKDTELKNWKLCAESIDIRNKWVCTIKELLMINDDLCLHKTANQPTVITKTVTQPIVLIPLPSRMCNENWDYSRHGLNWECECSEGHEQSPINLPPWEKAIPSPIKPLFQYEHVDAKSSYSTLDDSMREGQYIKIKNVDHALRIFHKYFGKVVTLDGAVYNAEEIVFHTPAEHTIDGKKFDMEMQVIHYGQTKGDIAKQVVLCFLFVRKPGIYNKFIDDVDFFNLPNPVSKEREIRNGLFIPKVFYSSDEDDLPIMRPFDFYTYQGSITFPPCTERTIVYVAAKPIQIGSTALQLFQEALRIPDIITQTGDVIVSNHVPENNRSIQPVNGRPIFYYKSCEIIKKKVVVPSGHYEKIIKEATKYFYVNGEDPSGLPGAFVVSKKEALGQNLA